MALATIGTALKIGASVASMFGGGGDKRDWTAYNQGVAKWHSDKNEYDNRGAALKIGEAGRRIGLSRREGDLMRSTLLGVGLTFKDMQDLQVEMGSKLTGGFHKGGESAARMAGRAAKMGLLAKRANAEAKLAKMGEATAIAKRGIVREYLSKTQWHGVAPAYHKIPMPKGPSTLQKLTGAIGRFSSTYGALGELGSGLQNLKSDFGSMFNKGGNTGGSWSPPADVWSGGSGLDPSYGFREGEGFN